MSSRSEDVLRENTRSRNSRHWANDAFVVEHVRPIGEAGLRPAPLMALRSRWAFAINCVLLSDYGRANLFRELIMYAPKLVMLWDTKLVTDRVGIRPLNHEEIILLASSELEADIAPHPQHIDFSSTSQFSHQHQKLHKSASKVCQQGLPAQGGRFKCQGQGCTVHITKMTYLVCHEAGRQDRRNYCA
jgi:hypothetical protein